MGLIGAGDGGEEIYGKNIPEEGTGPGVGQYCHWSTKLREVTEVTGETAPVS